MWRPWGGINRWWAHADFSDLSWGLGWHCFGNRIPMAHHGLILTHHRGTGSRMLCILYVGNATLILCLVSFKHKMTLATWMSYLHTCWFTQIHYAIFFQALSMGMITTVANYSPCQGGCQDRHAWFSLWHHDVSWRHKGQATNFEHPVRGGAFGRQASLSGHCAQSIWQILWVKWSPLLSYTHRCHV